MHTHTCSFEPATVGSTDGSVLLESSGVRPSHSIWCPPWMWNASPRREKHSCHHPTTVLSGSHCEWLLVVPCTENGPQVDAFCNHGGHQIERDGRTPEDSKRNVPPVLPTMAVAMEQVWVCARVLLWRWLVKRCHIYTITVLYHNSGNFLTTPRMVELVIHKNVLSLLCSYRKNNNK